MLHTDRRRFILASVLIAAAWYDDGVVIAKSNDVLILDDFSRDDLISTLGTPWRGFSDQVMGGISAETIALTEIDGRRCIRLTGDVRLENNGGFIQMALDLAPQARTLDGSSYAGVLLIACGNGESYGVHLRTSACVRPWQSYRAGCIAGLSGGKSGYRSNGSTTSAIRALDLRRLRRIGLVAIGRAFHADLAVGAVGLYG